MANKHQKHCIAFMRKYQGTAEQPKWHSFAKDRTTVETICSLHNLGILEVNEYSQCRLKSDQAARLFLGEEE